MNLEIIKHRDISDDILREIIEIKSLSWPYSYENQLEWINENIKDNDCHIILINDSKIVAYLNLIDITFEIDNTILNGFGIGNVCASLKGVGYGREIINQINNYLIKNNKIGILFCKESLVNFYSALDWKLINSNQVFLLKSKNEILTMIFNYSKSINKLTYRGILF